jgi:NADH-ubiquinone oxidoreductase chain 2
MLLASSIYILLGNAVTFRRDKSLSFNRITTIVLLYSLFLGFISLFIISIENGIGIYGGLFHVTSTTQNFCVFISLLGILILQLSSFYPRRIYNIPKFYISKNVLQIKNIDKYDLIGEKTRIIEYPLVMLFALIGAMCLMSSSDIISMFLSIELQSYGLYILSTIYRNSEFATSAGLTYFLLGGTKLHKKSLLICLQLSNSEDALKLKVPSYIRKAICG